MTFHMPDSWYEPPEPHDCPDADEGEDCRCEERAQDAKDDAAIERADAERKERE